MTEIPPTLTPENAQTPPQVESSTPLPEVPQVTEQQQAKTKKKWKGWVRGIGSLVLLVLLVWGLYDYANLQDRFRLTEVFLRERGEPDTSTPLSRYVDQSKETQEAVAQLKRDCETKTETAVCVTYSLNEESLACEEKPVTPCCGNNVCEENEWLSCAQECKDVIVQTEHDTPLTLRYEADRGRFTVAAQTFTVQGEATTLTAIVLPIQLALGKDIFVIQLYDLGNPDVPHSGTQLWKLELPTQQIRSKELRMTLPLNMRLTPNKQYSLVLGTKDRVGSVQVGMSEENSLDGGDLWIGRSTLSVATSSAEIQWAKQKGDLGFELELVKK